jgi:hypothetical protein
MDNRMRLIQRCMSLVFQMAKFFLGRPAWFGASYTEAPCPDVTTLFSQITPNW